MWTNLDVLWFSAILPLVLPIYLLWLYNSVGDASITFLLTVFLGLCALDIVLCVVTCIPLRFWPYVPYYVIVQNSDEAPAHNRACARTHAENLTS